MKTLIQIKDKIKTIATNHYQINNFADEKLWNLASSGTVNYPVFWSIYEGAELRRGEKGYRFTFLCLDIIQRGRDNLADIYNDTDQIISDVIAKLEWGNDPDVDLKVDSFSLQPVDEGYMDEEVAGHTVSVTIWTPFTINSCTIPTIT